MAKPRRPRSTEDCELYWGPNRSTNEPFVFVYSLFLHARGSRRAASVRRLRRQAAWLLRVADWWEAKGDD